MLKPQTSTTSNQGIGIWHLIAVHPDYRRTGISHQLLDGLLDEARREGKKVIHLDEEQAYEFLKRNMYYGINL